MHKTFSQPSTMSSSDSESTCSDLTDASEKSDVGSPVIQNLDIIMVTDATVGSGDDETNAVGKTVQMTAKNSSKTDAEGNSTQMTDSSSASASATSMVMAWSMPAIWPRSSVPGARVTHASRISTARAWSDPAIWH